MTAAPPMTADGFHPEFATLAEHIAGQRIGAYAASFSKHRIFVMQAIAEIWRCAADNLTPQRQLMRVKREETLEELALTIEAAAKRLRLKPDDALRRLQLDQLTAMRWWHAQFKAGRTAYATSMTFMLRHEAVQLMLKGQAEPAPERNAA